MTTGFTYEDGSFLLRLLIAHLIADFYLQKGSWVQSKMQKNIFSPYLWLHTFIAAVAAWLVLWSWNTWWVFVLTFVTHFFIDAWKTTATKKVVENRNHNQHQKARKELNLFVIDQLLHFVVILFVWLLLIGGFEKFNQAMLGILPNNHFLLRLTGYVLILQPTGFLIGFVTKRWLLELNLKDSLKEAGTWIGMLERVIVLTLIYINQFSAIGFLIAAKSILRVTDKPERNSDSDTAPFSSRKHTEYVLIGTFLSFGCALVIGIGINYLLTK